MRCPRFVLTLALALAHVGACGAGDPAGDPLPQAAVRALDLELSAKTKLPQGWTLLPTPGPTAEKLATLLRRILTESGLEADRLAVLPSELEGPQKASAVIVVVGAEPSAAGAGPAGVLAPLEARAAKHGWALRGVGGPSCVLLVAAPAPARPALLTAAASWAAEGLTTRAQTILEGNDPFGALALTQVALDLERRGARAHSLAGGIRWALALLKRPHGSYELAAKHREAALDEQAPYPLEPVLRATERALLGSTYLYMTGKDETAYAILSKAVSDPLLAGHEDLWNHRYNLACAAARLGKAGEALDQLGAVLARNAEHEVHGIEQWREDADFASLHAEPRWAELLKQHPEEE